MAQIPPEVGLSKPGASAWLRRRGLSDSTSCGRPRMPAGRADEFERSKSPSTSTLLREPLLRSSAQTVSVRVRSSGSKTQLVIPAHGAPSSADSSPDLSRDEPKAPSPFELVRRMPYEVWIVLLIDFLNSYRSFGFRSVQYQFLTNEYGLSDIETGQVLAQQAWLLVIFGFLGAMIVDSFGVRQTALCALVVSAISRGLLTFGRTKQTMLIALLGLSPFGEAVLSTGIYTVALKKLTTPETRSMAFGVQYGIFNFAGALADTAADFLRQRDFTLPDWMADERGNTSMSGLRMHVFVTWLAVLAALGVAYPFLHDAVVVPLDVSDASEQASPFSYVKGGKNAPSSPPPYTTDEVRVLRENATDAQRARGYVIAPIPRGKPKPPPPSYAPSPIFGRANLEALKKATSPKTWLTAVWGGSGRMLENARALCALSAFWRALWLSVCLLFLSKQWGDLDQLLPPFLERHYGVATPIYLIHSINMWVCMLGPTIASAMTSHLEDFAVMLPGIWVQALSPIWLAYDPSSKAAIFWVFFLSVGEVVWSPRQSAWVANLAPDGREGIFLAMLSLKTLITTLPSTIFNGWLNAAFQPNCPNCRDSSGHFCDHVARLNASFFACQTSDGSEMCVGAAYDGSMYAPELVARSADELHCPSTCKECPGWEGHADVMWLIVLISSVSSPIMVMGTLRFLRGEGDD